MAGIEFSQAVSRCRISDANRRMKGDGFTRNEPKLKDGLLLRIRFIEPGIAQGSELIRANDPCVAVPRRMARDFS